MGGEQASLVLSTVKRDALEARGESWAAKDQLNYERRIQRQYEKQGHPYYSSARLWDDGVIDPIHTRRILGQGISASMNNPRGAEAPHGIFRM
jgi:3-methylcrotonyl-CoA carboxylase beta subunit